MSATRKSFKTEKGTELPLLTLKGKEYLQVAHRLVWFREENPKGIIKTQMIAMSGEGDAEYAVFKSEVYVDSERGPLMIASAHKKETRGGFDDFIEKAETGSIGRALALAGYGTQFTGDELDEKDRLADSPVTVLLTNVGTASASATPAVSSGNGSGGRASFRKTKVTVGGGPNINGSTGGDDI
jgi:hypothetical protein